MGVTSEAWHSELRGLMTNPKSDAHEEPPHSGIIGNEGADACTRTAALTDTTDISLLDAKDPFHNFY
eukprot:1141461-Pelagomonas_calceolata.AAC.2